MALVKINGKDCDIPPGTNLLKYLLDNGMFVPHYCYHPGLSPEGNCRMCLIKTNQSRKPEPACMIFTPPKDGWIIETESTDVQKARKNVLEYMLVNHPLD